MYKKELDNLIKSNTLPKSLLLYGEDFSTSTYGKFIASKITPKENVLSFYFEEYHYESAKSYLSQPSLFGDTNLLYLKTDKKIPKKELDILVGSCEKNATSFLILEFLGEDRVGKDLTKSFGKKKQANFVRFFQPNPSEAIMILSKRAQKIGLKIEHYALQHLFALQNENIALASNELEKLLLLEREITVQDIDSHVYGMGEIGIDDFIERLLKKEDIKADLEALVEGGGMDEMRIISAFERYITQLMMFRLYITAHGRVDVLEIVGFPLPPAIVKERAALSSKIKLEVYQSLLSQLLEAEYKLKTSTNMDKKSFLLSTLIKLQTTLQ